MSATSVILIAITAGRSRRSVVRTLPAAATSEAESSATKPLPASAARAAGAEATAPSAAEVEAEAAAVRGTDLMPAKDLAPEPSFLLILTRLASRRQFANRAMTR